ncbi:response regulator [Aestuariirhabdus litorea]|uniref:Response regulator n=1 Tax=Aestuariirhabdus litorea TaxID=2528527 RepID=A0A3P3VNV2_9GAMM|nr:response regulator [Aestuariirhabdus litorea]RRJ84027.1 response regulator [Aestuariirhabdus litorea]RWW97247.1 response regulator [Endozoicomonadaceae bacterium GTF-13]
MRLLLVEDDPLIGQGVSDALNGDGTLLEWVTCAEHAESALLDGEFDLVILDLGLPGMDGLTLLSRIRQQGNGIPVLILTARDQVSDRVAGLDSGADDYLVKPFDLEELSARIRALVRRRSGYTSPVIQYRHLEVNPSSREVLSNGVPVSLSRREYALLMEFLHHPGKVFTRDQLGERLYGWNEGVESNSLEVHIHHLRKKIGDGLIHTVRGVGYRIEPLS